MSDEARKQAWLGAAGFFLLGATQLIIALIDRSWWKALGGTFALSLSIAVLVLDRRRLRRTAGMSKSAVRTLLILGFLIGLTTSALISFGALGR